MVLSPLLGAPLIAGALPTAVSAAGAAGGLVLVAGRARRWWTRTVPLAVTVAVAVAGLVAGLVAVLRPFPDLLPARMLFWLAVAVGAGVLAWRQRRARWWWRRVATGLALLAVLATCLVKANAFYGYRPTLAAALGMPAVGRVDLAHVPRSAPLIVARPHQPLARSWHPAPDMPRAGVVASVPIPGLLSHFPARPAWLYLPPAYLSSPRARLPVLVLIAGQPGGPDDWLLAGRLATVMDAFAAAHDGLAPVVVVPDATGSPLGNTLCVDSRLGAAESYLARDVPAWAAENLDVDPTHLAIGGFSFGGTCALQLALRHPGVYPTFLDVSGQAEPTLGTEDRTVQQAFGGDVQAFHRVDPIDELRARRFPDVAGVFAVGRDDPVYRPQDEGLAAAARTAGMAVTIAEYPGGHTWVVATAALGQSLPWIAGRTGLLDPVPAPGHGAGPLVSAARRAAAG